MKPSIRILMAAGAGVATPTLDTATEWWSPIDYSGVTIMGQRGASNLVGVNTPTFGNDGTYATASLTSAGTQYFQADGTQSIFDATGDFTVVYIAKLSSLTGTKIIVSNRDGSGNGYNAFSNGTTATMALDTGPNSTLNNSTWTAGVIEKFAIGRTATSTQFFYRSGGSRTTATQSGDASNTNFFRLNRGGGSTTLYSDQDFYGCAVFNGTGLTDGEIDTAISELLTFGTI